MKILITADWHIRGERPICRLDDDWIESQRETISAIREVYEKTGCEQMWILGDLFDAPKCATAAVNMLIKDEQKAKADKLLSCLKYLVMGDLIKDCPPKKVATEIVKEYDNGLR